MAVSFTTDRMLRFGDCDISGTAYYPSYLHLLNGLHYQLGDASQQAAELAQVVWAVAVAAALALGS